MNNAAAPTATSAIHLKEGDRFHLPGRRGMSPTVHVARLIETEGTTRIVTTDEGSFRLRPQSKVWVAG